MGNRNRYKQIISECSDFELKGKNMLYTSANGYMFSLVNKDNEIGIRFSKEVQEKYFETLNTTYFKSHGATMKGYILLPQEVLDNTELMISLLNESHQYVMSLEPK